jgi:hypothetical protein
MIKAEITSRKVWNGELSIQEKEFNDEQHLNNYIKAIIRNGNLKYKYVNHRIIHANEKAMFNLNQMQRVFDLAKENKYSSLRELIAEEFKLKI